MNKTLQKIAASKKAEIEILKVEEPLEGFESHVRTRETLDFKSAISALDEVSIIAELKRGSPSRGIIAPDFNPMILARQYREGGAAALSVLTEREHFFGHYEFVDVAGKAAGLPVLCKDFFVDPYQIYHARKIGADAILLIVRLLAPGTIRDFLKQARAIGLDCLVETHTEEEVRIAADCGADIIGVNNRNLDDFSVSLQTAENLANLIPSDVVKVAESGIFTPEHVARLRECGYNAFLIGEALVTADNPSELLKSLRDV